MDSVNTPSTILSPHNWSAVLKLDNSTLTLSDNGEKSNAQGQLSLVQTALPLGYRLQLKFTPTKKATIAACWLSQKTALNPTDYILCNGFQSWTDSPYLHPTDGIPQLRRIAQPLMGYYGDYHIPWIVRQKGHLHSWSWTELRRADEPLLFLGSLNENTAFSCFQWQYAQQQLQIQSDCRQLTVHEPIVLLDVVLLSGEVNEVYDIWTKALELPALTAQPARGWTSWYQHYTDVSESIVRDNLQAFKDRRRPLDYFQIDDGFQTAVGDWLSINDSFPRGMQAVAEEIKATGYTPGLWLAPTVAGKRSNLLKNNPEWVAKNRKGKALKAGYNPLWGGWFYALDTQHPGWLEYMIKVLGTVVQEWGFGMLKLDFLYAACIYPTSQKTRAQLMHECLTFIKHQAGEARLLGCGTPLASGFGVFDYCRIGADIHLEWEHRMLRWFRHRERVSTLVALRSTLSRWPLAGRVWRNDPDVYLLRDENIQLTRDERQLVHRVNTLLGELLFTSDNVSTYNNWQTAEENWQRDWFDTPVSKVTITGNDQFEIITEKGGFALKLGHKTGSLS